jgi:hypothetical protein
MKATLQSLFLVVGIAALDVTSTHASGKANLNPGIVPPQAVFKGKTMGEWTAAWWNWVLNTPDTVQMTDSTGEFAHVNNNGADGVFFLAKTWTGVPQTRQVTVPPGTALYIPVMGLGLFGDEDYWAWVAELEGIEPSGIPDVMAWMDSWIPEMKDLSVVIDGKPVRGLENGNLHYLNDTGLTSLSDADGNVWAPVGYSYEISLILLPLQPGRHVIEMKGKGTFGFETDVTYHLTVSP